MKEDPLRKFSLRWLVWVLFCVSASGSWGYFIGATFPNHALWLSLLNALNGALWVSAPVWYWLRRQQMERPRE